MVSIIVAAHGSVAPELLATARMILGPFEQVTPVEFLPDQGPDDLIAEYQKMLIPIRPANPSSCWLISSGVALITRELVLPLSVPTPMWCRGSIFPC